MKPVLFNVFGWPIVSYGLFMILGFTGAFLTVLWIAPSRRVLDGGFSRAQVKDLFLVMLVTAIFGSKVGHVVFEAPGHIGSRGQPIESVTQLLADDPGHWLWIHQPGYVWYGGMIACLIVAAIYFLKRPKLNGWLFADAFAPAIMIGASVGRLGCFLGGCCYGVPTDMPWGMQFPHLEKPVHPTQLYDASIAFILGVGLLWRWHCRRFDGENITLLLITYPLFRALTEIFRGDAERGAFGPLSTSQWISIPLFVMGIFLYLRLLKVGRLTVFGEQEELTQDKGLMT